MNITFLIGNGFDINLGMATKYSDFVQKYKIIKDSDSELLKKFKDDISKNEQNWAFAELEFGKYTDKFDGEKRTIDDFFECHINFCNELAVHLENEEGSVLFESTFAKTFAKDILNLDFGMRGEPRALIKGFIDDFNNSVTYNFLTFNYTRIIDRISDELKVGNVLGNRIMRNGTYRNIVGKVLHVHGYTNKDMILGVNDVSQIRNPKLFENQDELYLQAIIKQSTNELCEEGTDRQSYDLIKMSDLIYIYGMSIGDTDAIWWERICAELASNKRKRLIIYVHGAPPDERNRLKYKLFEKQQLEHFVGFYKGTEEQKKVIMSKITVVRENIFANLANVVKINRVDSADSKNDSNKNYVTEEIVNKSIDGYMAEHTITNEDIDNIFLQN